MSEELGIFDSDHPDMIEEVIDVREAMMGSMLWKEIDRQSKMPSPITPHPDPETLSGDIYPSYGNLQRKEVLPKVEHMPKESMCRTNAF